MLKYEPSAKQDLALYQWYEQLVLSRDMQKGFGEAYYSLSAFLGNFQEPTVLLTEGDEKGFWFCMWAKPSYVDAADIHIWVREAKRHTKIAYEAVQLALATLLQQFAFLIAVAIDEKLAQIHIKIGFDVVGMLPAIEKYPAAQISVLTRERFRQLAREKKAVNA